MSTLPVRFPYRHRQRPTRDPHRPIPIPTPDAAMRALCRATIASGLGAINRSLLLDEYAARQWPEDAAVPLLLRAVGSLAMTTNTPALAIVAEAFLAALVPQSAELPPPRHRCRRVAPTRTVTVSHSRPRRRRARALSHGRFEPAAPRSRLDCAKVSA